MYTQWLAAREYSWFLSMCLVEKVVFRHTRSFLFTHAVDYSSGVMKGIVTIFVIGATFGYSTALSRKFIICMCY